MKLCHLRLQLGKITDSLLPKSKKDWYTPKELGFNFPKARRVYIGRCGDTTGNNMHTYNLSMYSSIAHAHLCGDDPQFGTICIYNRKLINFRNGQVMKHEYAHLISGLVLYCSKHSNLTNEEIQILGHGPEFVSAMYKLGEIPSRYLDATAEEWKWLMNSEVSLTN